MFPGKTHIQKLNKNKIPQFFSSPDAIKITELQSEVGNRKKNINFDTPADKSICSTHKKNCFVIRGLVLCLLHFANSRSHLGEMHLQSC